MHRCEQCTFSSTRFDKLREHQLHHHAVGTPPERRKRSTLAEATSTSQANSKTRRPKASNGLVSPRITNADNDLASKDSGALFETVAANDEDDRTCEGTAADAKASGALEVYSFEAEKADDSEHAVYSLTSNCFPSLQVLPLAQTLFVSHNALPVSSSSLTDFILSQPLDDISVLDSTKAILHEIDPPGDLMLCDGLFQAELNLGCSLELIGTSIITDSCD